MRIKNIVLSLSVLLTFVACFEDETKDATNQISEITIQKGSIVSQYDIDKNETLSITPQIVQSHEQKVVYYTWEVDQKVYSTSPTLEYVGDELGSFTCRLVVENEDGKAFFPFILNVNSPYEEGFVVISKDETEEGKSMLSFMLKQREEGIDDHFDEGDCFTLNNPDYSFAANVTDVVHCDDNLVVMCQGNPTASSPATIYSLNDKTFVIENMIEVPEYSDFIPYRMILPEKGTVGGYPILCENGKVYDYSQREGVVSISSDLKSTYSKCSVLYYSGSASYNNFVFWDKELNAMCHMYNGYGPFYCGEPYLLAKDSLTESNNYFQGYDFVFMFQPRTTDVKAPCAKDMIVITKKGALYQKLTISSGFWTWNNLSGVNELSDYGGMKMAGFGCDFTEETPHIASDFYKMLYYGVGNKLKVWEYTFGNKFLDNVPVKATVGTPDAVITSMELSQNHAELFVAFYEPQETGLNGHVWVLDTQTYEVLRKYENVSYRPVKIMYKKR